MSHNFETPATRFYQIEDGSRNIRASSQPEISNSDIHITDTRPKSPFRFALDQDEADFKGIYALVSRKTRGNDLTNVDWTSQGLNVWFYEGVDFNISKLRN